MDMTHYAVRDDLSFCRVGEQFVFLDINNDRYFRLPQPLEQALVSHLEGNGTSDLDISGLIERNILVDQPGSTVVGRRSIKPALRSAMEAPPAKQKIRAFELLEVLAIVLHTRLELKLFALKHVLDGLGADRHIQPVQTTPPTALLAHRLSDAAAVYRRARLYVPVDMCCLLDSIAMAKFLRRRQLHVHVVFGVALDPFSAHCWVQADDLVLNDTVGNVDSHTPIRVV
jgi:Transglutaminase-like superfamily